MYSSATTTQASSRQGGYSKSYTPQIPQGFTVRVFKGPSVYSIPQATASHFDRGYQSIPLNEPRQNSSNQIWYPRAQTATSAPSETQKPRPSTNSGTSLSNDTRIFAYDPNSRPQPPSYSIYQSSNDTFVYEASLSSKADLNSNSDDSTTTAEYTPSSAFSPAMSTDSITTVRGANTPDASLTDLRTPIAAPTSLSSRIPFPLHIPGLAQAQTAIKGIFRSQTQHDSQPAANTSFTSRAANASSSTSSAKSSVATPIRMSETASRSGPRDTGSSTHHDGHALIIGNACPTGLRSPISDVEDSEVDPIAKANAEYNAAASRAGSSAPHYSSVRDSMYLPAMNSTGSGTGVRNTTSQLHQNLPLHNSPEQYHSQATTSHVQPSYWGAPEMTRLQNVANGHNTLPSAEQSVSTAQIPLLQNSGSSSRYIPASRTMTPGQPLSTSPESRADRDRHEQISASSMPPSVRERKTSVFRGSPTITGSQGPVPREGGGAGTGRSASSADESRRGSIERQASYVPYRAEVLAPQEPPTVRTASHQAYNTPSNHYATATIQSNRNTAPDINSRYMTSTATRLSGSVISHTLDPRTSTEQAYMLPSQQSAPQSRTHTLASSSGERASNYVNSASTHGTGVSPPRTRRDSLAASTNGLLPRSSNVETNTVLHPVQGRPQQDQRTSPSLGQSSVYQPQNSRFDDTHNPRGREYGSRLETERFVAEPYSRTSERQAAVSDIHPQQGLTTNITASSSARSRPETLAHTAAVPDHSTPFPAPLREPQRRYSDGDSSVASHSTYGPAYTSYSGANVPPAGTSTTTEAPRTESQPQRRYSDGESNVPERKSLILFRTVRWNENLICPSPIFAHQRRKGWFNRRGDQLWTNDGAYKPASPGQEYPPDLDGYPEHGEGWMNEQGVRIDMTHRLIPKVPLKSALKATRSQPLVVQQDS